MSLHAIYSSLAGNEDLGTDVVTTATVEELVEARVDAEVAEATAAVAEAEKEVEQMSVAIEAVEEKIEELEEQIDGMESMLNGTKEYNAALFAHQFAQASKIANRFGGEQVSVLGAESLADVATAQLNAVAGVESFKEKVKAAATGVKNFFIKLFNSFINMVKGFFNKFQALENRANGLAEKVGKKDQMPKLVKPANAAGWVGADGKAPDVAGALTALEGAMDRIVKGDVGALSGVLNKLKGFGSASPVAAPAQGVKAFRVAVNKGELVVAIPEGAGNLAKAAVSINGVKGEVPEQDALSKEAAVKVLKEAAAAAAAFKGSKLTEKGLTAARDKAIAEVESAEDKQHADLVKGGATAGLKALQGVNKLGIAVIEGKIALGAAHA